MVDSLAVNFEGPFSWPGTVDAPSIHDHPMGSEQGIYVWTVQLESRHAIYYVGHTGRSFSGRLMEHLLYHCACMYHVYAPEELTVGNKVQLWPGRYDPANRKSIRECIAAAIDLKDEVAELTQIYRFFVAPLTVEKRMRERVEASLAHALYSTPGFVGDFQDTSIRYLPRRPSEIAVQCDFSCSTELIGLPPRLEV